MLHLCYFVFFNYQCFSSDQRDQMDTCSCKMNEILQGNWFNWVKWLSALDSWPRPTPPVPSPPPPHQNSSPNPNILAQLNVQWIVQCFQQFKGNLFKRWRLPLWAKKNLSPFFTALAYSKIIWTLEWSILIALYWARRCSDTINQRTKIKISYTVTFIKQSP